MVIPHFCLLVKEGKISVKDGNTAVEAEHQAQMPKTEWEMFIQEKLDKNQILEDEAQAALEASVPTSDPLPQMIAGMEYFFQDLMALLRLLASESPPKVNIRARLIIMIIYSFVDASGRGFGSTVLGKDGT
jgi:hypothetical protein